MDRARFVATALVLLATIASIGCRRRRATIAIEAEPSALAPAPGDAATDGAPGDAKSTPPPPRPSPAPPPIACATDPRVRWELPAPDTGDIAYNSGAARFDCSPMKTGDAPLELTVAPGTILTFPVRVELADGGGASTYSPTYDVTYTTAGLPTGAWVDPAEPAFKWHVRGADGEAFAFTIAAQVELPEGKRCVTASMRVRVEDDDETRRAQAEWVNREAINLGWTNSYWGASPPLPPAVLDDLHDERCGAVMVHPEWRDADGDGQSDAIFVYPYRGGGYPNVIDVLLRRGDSFAKVGEGSGSVEHAGDGTTFLVDTASAGTGYPCSIGIKILQVYKNRVSVVVDEPTRAPLGDTMDCPGGGMTVDRTGTTLIGFTDRALSAGVVTKRVWRWNGKRFALLP